MDWQGQLTSAGEQALQSLSQRYGVSVDAVRTLLFAVSAGGGTMAQFYHQELGGGGQWMRGGMTMVGDMFNNGLKATVSGLCSELADLLASQQVFVPSRHAGQGAFAATSNAWWPAEFGNPSTSGGQNDVRYAYFPGVRRLVIERGGQHTIYDTLDHQIGGVQQQQGGGFPGLSFSSQRGTFSVDSLPIAQPTTGQAHAVDAPPQFPAAQGAELHSPQDILALLERLAQLHQQGALSDEEFRNKKAALLAKL